MLETCHWIPLDTDMIIAGIDEAGYGPLLGPLVVSATALELADRSPSCTSELPLEPDSFPCCWRLLKSAVVRKAPASKGRILIADSKLVHRLSEGNKHLERGVLASLCGLVTSGLPEPLTAAGLLEILCCADHQLTVNPWYAPQRLVLPRFTDPGDIAIAAGMLAAAMSAAHLRLVSMRTRVVSEWAFNRLVAGTRNKASALTSITLTFLFHLHQAFGQQGLVVGVDKQGARDHYTALLLRTFPDAQLKVLLESDTASSYLLRESTPNGLRRTVVHFCEKADGRFFPTALASMLCKYLRELCMHSFNAWWCDRITGLRPTAGYHQDGTRWLMDVAPHLPRLGIARETLVRTR